MTKYRKIFGAARVFFKWTPGEPGIIVTDDVGHGAIPAVDPAEVFGAGANLKRRLTSLFIPLNASG